MAHFLTTPNIWKHLEQRHINTHNTKTHVGNSIFTIRQGEALPYSTQSRETITREGEMEGGGGGLSGNKAEVSFLLMTCKLKGRTQSVLCAHTVRCSCISPSITVGMVIQPKHLQWSPLKMWCICKSLSFLLTSHSVLALCLPHAVIVFCYYFPNFTLVSTP